MASGEGTAAGQPAQQQQQQQEPPSQPPQQQQQQQPDPQRKDPGPTVVARGSVEAAPNDLQGQQQTERGEARVFADEQQGPHEQQQPEQQEPPQQQPGDQEEQSEGSAGGGEAEALKLAEALKREGNGLFGRGAWDEAAAKYNEALDAAPASAAREKAIYFANLAACNIKTQQYAVAVQNCTEAIRLDGSYQKAYMRRSEAFERLDELDHALSDAKSLLEVAPDSAWARARVALLQPRVDERTETLKTEMFSKLKELGNTVLGKFGMSVDNFKFDKDPNTGGYSIRFER